jgi:uncharacterized small protein (DUF1192 family)
MVGSLIAKLGQLTGKVAELNADINELKERSAIDKTSIANLHERIALLARDIEELSK